MNQNENEYQKKSLSEEVKSPPVCPSWSTFLGEEFNKPYMQALMNFLAQEKAAGKQIFPKETEYYLALNSSPLNEVKVVILGQDPYHGLGQAHGLCFSVQRGVDVPPSLVNIYKELHNDCHILRPSHGYLQAWADQGVLLLNSVLTVEMGKAASHQGKGWEIFTDKVIQVLNQQREGLVFVLWGAYAQKKAAFVDREKHLVLEAPHPSPLSAHRGFFGTKPFSKINAWLESKNLKTINWNLES